MKKLPKYLILLLLPILITISYGDDRITETRAVSDFSEVQLGGSGKVYLTQGDTEKLIVEAQSDVMPFIETEVRGNNLYLGVKKYRNWGHTGQINYYLTMKDISRLKISGSGDIICEKMDTDDLKLQISGSGDIELQKVQAGKIASHISGSGECSIDGQANYQDISISGSGEYSAADVKSKKVDISVSGSGDVTVWAIDKLDVSISGSGRVGYYGRPAVNSRSSGSGSTKHLGDR